MERKKFSQLSESGYKRQKIADFWKFIKKISGDDSAEFLMHILKTPRGREIFNLLDKCKFLELVSSIRSTHDKVEPNRKHIVLASASQSSLLSRRELQKLDFKFSTTQYKRAIRLNRKPKYQIKKNYYGPPEDAWDISSTWYSHPDAPPAKKRKINKSEPKPLSLKRPRNECNKYCYCGKEDTGELMIQCDHCNNWYHRKCIEFGFDIEGAFYCADCEEFENTPKFQKVWKVEEPGIDPKPKKISKPKKKPNEKLDPLKPSGINRKGFTCYMISTLQLFFSQEDVRNKIIQETSLDPVFTEIQKIALQYSKFSTLDIENFVKVVEQTSLTDNLDLIFTAQEENDPREFIYFCLKHMPDSISTLFHFETNTQIKCTKPSSNCFARLHSETELHLNLKTLPNSTLSKLIDLNFEKHISGDGICPDCNEGSLELEAGIIGTSEYLIISLNRFSYDGPHQFKTKDATTINRIITVGDSHFSLVANLDHIGHTTSHYKIFVDFQKGSRWFKLDDNSVVEVSRHSPNRADCYILLFKKIHLQDDNEIPAPILQADPILKDASNSSEVEQPKLAIDLQESLEVENWEFSDVKDNVLTQVKLLHVYELKDKIFNTEIEGKTQQEKDLMSRTLIAKERKLNSRQLDIEYQMLDRNQAEEIIQKETVFLTDFTGFEFNVFGEEILLENFSAIEKDWLGDTVINGYAKFLIHNSENQIISSHSPPLYGQKIFLKDEESKIKLESKFKKKINYVLENKSNLFIPVHLGGIHWGLIFVETITKTIYLLDPMKNMVVGADILDFKDFLTRELPDFTVQTLKGSQKDTDSCGPYILFYIACFVQNLNIQKVLRVSQKYVKKFRTLIAFDISHFKSKEKSHASEDESDAVVEQFGGGLMDDISDTEEEFIDIMSCDPEEISTSTEAEDPEEFIDIMTCEDPKDCYSSEVVFGCHCGYETTDKSNMTKHVVGVEEKEKPYKCTFPQCDKRFSQPSNRNTHMKKVHLKQKEEKKSRRPQTDKQTQKLINESLTCNSSPGSGTNDGIKVRYIEYSWQHCFNLFQQKHKNIKISLPTFRKYAANKFKKAKRKTDLCGICEKKKHLEKQLNQQNVKKRDDIEAEIYLIDKHLERAHCQRDSFKQEIETLAEGNGVLVMDFKQNVELGGSKREISKIFFEKQQRTVFGLVLYFNRRGKIEKRNFGFVSEVLSHDSWIAIKCISKLLKLRVFPKVKNLSIWSDGGPHFRSFEMLRFLDELPEQTAKVDSVELSFFIEYHGKNPCDSFFSEVSQMLNSYEMKHTKPIETTEELIICLQDEIRRLGNIHKNFVFELTPEEATRQATIEKLTLKTAKTVKKKTDKRKKKKKKKSQEKRRKKNINQTPTEEGLEKSYFNDYKSQNKEILKKQKKDRENKKQKIKYNFTDCYSFKFRKELIEGRILSQDTRWIEFWVTYTTVTESRRNKINNSAPPSVNVPLFSAKCLLKEERRNSITSVKMDSTKLNQMKTAPQSHLNTFSSVKTEILSTKEKIEKLEKKLQKLEAQQEKLQVLNSF